MRKLLGFLLLGFLLSGCYAQSLTMVGPATGIAHGKISESALTSSLNYAVKAQTGKTPLEHVLTKQQIATIEEKKKKLNPCANNLKLCSAVKENIEKTRKKMFGLNLQARIEVTHQKIKNISKK